MARREKFITGLLNHVTTEIAVVPSGVYYNLGWFVKNMLSKYESPGNMLVWAKQLHAAFNIFEVYRILEEEKVQALLTLSTLTPEEIDKMFDKKVVYVLKDQFK